MENKYTRESLKTLDLSQLSKLLRNNMELDNYKVIMKSAMDLDTDDEQLQYLRKQARKVLGLTSKDIAETESEPIDPRYEELNLLILKNKTSPNAIQTSLSLKDIAKIYHNSGNEKVKKIFNNYTSATKEEVIRMIIKAEKEDKTLKSNLKSLKSSSKPSSPKPLFLNLVLLNPVLLNLVLLKSSC
jgi:hypothetical protein